MKKREFIKKWRAFLPPKTHRCNIEKEFISDLDDLMEWYKHELWDKWNDKTNQQ